MSMTELINIIKNLKGRGSEIKLVETGKLRTLFDPASHEWNLSNMDEKIQLIEEFIKQGLNLSSLISFYQEYYIENKKGNGNDIAWDAVWGLATIFENYVRKNLRLEDKS